MAYSAETPFDNIESAQEYVALLLEAIEEAQREVNAELDLTQGPQVERRRRALQLVAHNLNRLAFHIAKSRRILNDLRTLRRLLLEEREAPAAAKSSAVGAA
ncbi:MAG: hypothetical protein RMK57_11965 [Bryobacterales bacterium]|nr:hypothetical protein [Bryobacteraceae bacterium]MDW8355236.1 hypothetical protein [Bryobacterales bacterium]